MGKRPKTKYQKCMATELKKSDYKKGSGKAAWQRVFKKAAKSCKS